MPVEIERTNGGSHATATQNGYDNEHTVEISLTDEQMAAVEGWRAANSIRSREEAVQELVRIGLLSEIASVYRLVARARDEFEDHGENGLNARG